MWETKTKRDRTFDIVNLSLLVLLVAIILYPLYFTVIASFSNPVEVMNGRVLVWIRDFTVESYANVFRNDEIWTGYANTIFYTAVGTAYALMLTIPCAYSMSRRGLKGKNAVMAFFVVTMYFSGGMIPSYLLIKNMQLIDTRWVLILPAGMSVYNMIVTRTFYQSNMPEELYEAAKIDGANEFTIFFRIALPLSGAILAVMGLFYAVGQWNSYFSALMYINDKALYPLQLVLRNILLLNQQLQMDMTSMSAAQIKDVVKRAMMAETMKYALIFISSLPILILYPFVQKFFVQGVMIGSVKG